MWTKGRCTLHFCSLVAPPRRRSPVFDLLCLPMCALINTVTAHNFCSFNLWSGRNVCVHFYTVYLLLLVAGASASESANGKGGHNQHSPQRTFIPNASRPKFNRCGCLQLIENIPIEHSRTFIWWRFTFAHSNRQRIFLIQPALLLTVFCSSYTHVRCEYID